ncbi:MAG: hypothetical protein AAFX86_07220 [Pseudomonadota bacterium]
MEKPLRATLIDATGPGVFERLGDQPPPVVSLLLGLEADTGVDHAPPVIACAEADTARARGAFIVSGDGDGIVLGLDPIGPVAARASLLCAFAETHAPGADICLWDAASGTLIPFTHPTDAIGFSTTDRRGVLVPNAQNWAALIARMETAE